MRTFDFRAVMLHESFEGYRNLTELLESWAEVDAAGIATLSLNFDPYSVGGQRKHPRFTVNNTSGSAGTVKLQSVDTRGHNYWMPNTASVGQLSTIVGRYRCSSGLAGSTVAFAMVNSIIPGGVSATVTADGQWHELTSADYLVFEDSIYASGLHLELSAIPNGANGTIDFDDLRLRRVDQIKTGIDNACPVASMRADWAEGYRESIGWPTHVLTAKDGSEHRSQLRILPRMRVEYQAVLGDPQESMWLDAWLFRNQANRVAVPRWQDALRFVSIEQSNTWIWLSGGTTTDRWFWPEQRVMLWRAPDDYEAVQIWQVGTNYVRLDVNVNQVQGSWDSSTLVVPLLPGRLSSTVSIQRPNGRTGVVPLAFDLDLVA